MFLSIINAPYWFKVTVTVLVIIWMAAYVYSKRNKYSTGKLILLIIVFLLGLLAAYMRANPDKFY